MKILLKVITKWKEVRARSPVDLRHGSSPANAGKRKVSHVASGSPHISMKFIETACKKDVISGIAGQDVIALVSNQGVIAAATKSVLN